MSALRQDRVCASELQLAQELKLCCLTSLRVTVAVYVSAGIWGRIDEPETHNESDDQMIGDARDGMKECTAEGKGGDRPAAG